MYKLLLVEDNEMIVKGLTYTLEQNGFLLKVAFSKKEANEYLKNDLFDLIILDITLPDGSGLDLGRMIKENYKGEIMFLTARDEEDIIVNGLELGAEDYIVKPFRTRELLSRINNILKRISKNNKLIWDNIEIDFDKCEVKVDQKEVKLTSLEYKILALLFHNINKVVTRDIIIDKIWDMDGNFVNDNTLSVYIKRIREKLQNEEIIKTIKGIGYRIDSK